MSTFHGIGIWSGGLRRHEDAGAVREAAAELEQLGYSALFIPGGRGGDDIFPASLRLLEATRAVPVALGVLNIWMHEADEVARECARLDAAFPGRFVAGLGISHPSLVDGAESKVYGRPLETMGAYLDVLGEAEPPVRSDQLLLAALAPRMLELARERTGGAHPYFVPVEHTAFAREALGEGPVLAVEQAVTLTTDPEHAREIAREHMAIYLTFPNYVRNLLRHGFTEDDMRDGGSDRLVDGIVAFGEEAIAERVAAHVAAGADHVCLQVIGPESQHLPLRDWRQLAESLDLSTNRLLD
jgi:probable F420-dependent oxidoreductase